MIARKPEVCPECGQPYNAICREVDPTFVGDTFIRWDKENHVCKPTTQDNKIASFEDACKAVAEKYGYDAWAHLWIKRDQSYMIEAAELYAEAKAREAWERACEAQRQICADNARMHYAEDYNDIDSDSILNAPKPDYQP